MNPEKPTKLQGLRKAIAKLLTDAEIWPEGSVLTTMQTDIWNDVAVACGVATHGCVCVIHTKTGNATEPDSLEQDLTVAVTILAPHTPTPGDEPLELLWQRTISKLHNAQPQYEGGPGEDSWNWRMRFQGWSDAPELIPPRAEEAVQQARQTTFLIRFSLESER
jgi:hypothetical protein